MLKKKGTRRRLRLCPGKERHMNVEFGFRNAECLIVDCGKKIPQSEFRNLQSFHSEIRNGITGQQVKGGEKL